MMILNDEMNLISYEGGNLMYVFNKITVTPQLPERINCLKLLVTYGGLGIQTS